MKLNIDCMRDILLIVEDAPFLKPVFIDTIHNNLTDYENDVIDYAILKLVEADYITAVISHHDFGFKIHKINDITFSGHQFIAEISSNTIWNSVKSISTKVGAGSIHAISQIATGVITSIIKAQLNLS